MVNGLRCRKRSLVKGSDRRLRGAVSGGGERSQVEGSGRWWRGAVSGGGEWSQVEGTGLRWRGAGTAAQTARVLLGNREGHGTAVPQSRHRM